MKRGFPSLALHKKANCRPPRGGRGLKQSNVMMTTNSMVSPPALNALDVQGMSPRLDDLPIPSLYLWIKIEIKDREIL